MKRTTFKRMLAGALNCMMLPMFSLAVSAQETNNPTAPMKVSGSANKPIYGDYSLDGVVDVQDAACLLGYIAERGSGTTASFEDYLTSIGIVISPDYHEAPTGLITGDVNWDFTIDAKDAAMLLQYAAEVGTGYTDTLWNYVMQAKSKE